MITLREAFERYFQAKARKRSLAEDQKIAKHLKTEFGEKTPLAEITASRISQHKTKRLAVKRDELALSAAPINRSLALLCHLLRLACEEWEVFSSAPKIRLEKEGQGRLRWLTPEEAKNLLTNAASRRTMPSWCSRRIRRMVGMESETAWYRRRKNRSRGTPYWRSCRTRRTALQCAAGCETDAPEIPAGGVSGPRVPRVDTDGAIHRRACATCRRTDTSG